MKKLLYVAVAAMAIVACKKSSDPAPTPTPTEPGSIVLDEDVDPEPTVDGDSTDVSIAFTASLAWTCTADGTPVDWISFAPVSGDKGHNEIIFKCIRNEEEEARSATFVITCGEAKQNIIITQEIYKIIEVDENRFDITSEEQNIEIVVTSNCYFTTEISYESKWITEVKEGGDIEPTILEDGMMQFNLKFKAEKNTGDERDGWISFYNGEAIQEVLICQAGEQKPE